MSRKIQEFFKAIPKEKAVKLIKDSNLESSKENTQERQVILNDKSKKIGNKNSDKNMKLSDKTKNSDHNCKFCEKKFANISYLIHHMKYVHPNELKDIFECHICQQKFIRKCALEKHMKVKHFDENIQPFECDFCGKLTKNRRYMSSHMEMHRPTVKCHICQAELKPRGLKVHLNNTHATDWKFQCTMCPKTFKGLKFLRNHKKVHDRKFQCTTCMKTFPFKCKLLQHQREIHENPRSYSCEICNIKVNRKDSLKEHKKIHDRNRPKPIKCQRCGFATDTRTKFKKHLKAHQRKDERFAAMKNPLKCPNCPTFCRNKFALNKHVKIVHTDEPYQCDLCGKYMKRINVLKHHINFIHQQRKLLIENQNY